MANIIKHQDFIGLYDNVLSQDECDLIIKELNVVEEKNPEKIVNSADEYGTELTRKDFAIAADAFSVDIHNLVGEKLHECLMYYCEYYFVAKELPAQSLEVKLQRTPPRGGYHIWHCEQDSSKYANRVLVWTIYLNDIPYNEGETEFLWQGIRINPKAGRCAIWPAAFTHTHRGNPVYTHDKYIATGWYTLI